MRQLSENTRKTILWSIVIVLGIILLFWWGRDTVENFQTLSLPEIPQEMIQQFQFNKNGKTGE